MNVDNTRNTPITLVPKNENELALLRSYHAYLSEQVNKMELHTLHKQDVQKILVKGITMASVNSQQFAPPRKTSFFSTMFHRMFG